MSSKFKVQSLRLKVGGVKLPFVLVNMAMTADGKIATASRLVSSFGSAYDHEHLLALRATADAVMAGARTVDSAPINLGPGSAEFRRQRLERGLEDYHLRVVVSRSGSINPRAKIFQHRFSPILILTTRRTGASRLKRLRAVADVVKICGRSEINFNAAFRWLRREWRVKRLLCEGGGELNAALFRAGLVDELHLTICPKIFGGHRAPTIAEGLGFSSLAAAERFQVKYVRQIGGELFTVFERS
jgi:2,5-diamino-6-(ribosylamino)-4(3H)-pyrimidinone 5'-phosphate reductase